MKWESSRTMIWDSGDVAVSEYLQIIHQAQGLSENLRNEGADQKKDDELLHRVQIVIRIAMVKLEEEFIHILVCRNLPFEPECMSFHSSDVGTMDGISVCSFELDQNLVDESPSRYGSSRSSGELVVDLVHQYAIHDLNRIVSAMFTTHFDQECCDAYIKVRKDALAECLFMLEVDNLSNDAGQVALHTENSSLVIKIRKWNQAMKNFTGVYLASEKLLCDRIFGEFKSVSSTCFGKIFEVPMLQLLKCGETIIDIEGREPEKVFLKLDMYEVLLDLLPDIDSMFLEEAGSSVRFVFREVLKRFGDSVSGTVLEFEKAVGSNISTKPVSGGCIHPLSQYVMNFIEVLARDYSDTLNTLLEVSHRGDLPEEKENANVHPLAYHLKLVVSNLKSNLGVKSSSYTDDGLRYIFLMNNNFFMVSKIKDSDLRQFFGDDWIRQHREYQGYAMDYERATWSPILNLLREEGMCTPGSHSISKAILKERLKDFNLSLEKVYKSQTAWLIPDPRLCEELRISVAINVIQAYRTFLGRHEGTLSATSTAKYMKYNADGLQTFISDLFGGSPKLLPNSVTWT
ncbi:hypothetical protein MKW94_022259 [Papaver nudicaule]|uniref:Exocyst subunit Exo70 family protein n=1 Tax=Papaver nudicaule TaxID=74823 RepID=A0AA41RYE0_PAPNU|nr:hypothetical protein [Papaver nudicaule]